MKDGGKIIKDPVREDVSIKMVMFMMACGSLTRESMDKECIHLQMDALILAKWKTTNSMVLVKKLGLMVRYMKEITFMGPNKDKEFILGLMEKGMKETGPKT